MNGDRRQETLMRKIQENAFVAHECVLYLDGHPTNRRALEKHAEAVKKLNEAVAEYESLYGPLTANASEGTVDWNWVRGRWPWQNYD